MPRWHSTVAGYASTSPLRQEEGSDLTNISHRVEERRPEVENLKTNNALHVIDGYVDCLARRQRLQVAPLFLARPGLINGGMNPLCSGHRKHARDAASVCREGAPYPRY